MKLSEVVDNYWLAKELSFSETTKPGYRRTFSRLISFAGNVEIESITPADVRRFLVSLRDLGCGNRTVSDAWVPLSGLWTWANNEFGIPHVIRGKVERPRFTRTTISPLSHDDLRRLVGVLEKDAQGAMRKTGQRDRALILSMLDTGARVSEICALTVGDYSPRTGRLLIRHGKGDKERFVVVGARTQEAISAWMDRRGQCTKASPLFASNSTGKHLRRDSIKHLFARLGKRAGVDNFHPHRMRHTFAVNFLRNGGNVMTLQMLLGHTDLSMSRRYVALAEQDIDAARQLLPVDALIL